MKFIKIMLEVFKYEKVKIDIKDIKDEVSIINSEIAQANHNSYYKEWREIFSIINNNKCPYFVDNWGLVP